MPAKMLAAVAFGLCIYLVFELGWYVTRPHESRLPDLLPYMGYAFAGVAVGWIEDRGFVFAAIVLGLLIPPMSGVVHWGACHFDARLDVCGLQAIMVLEMILLPASVGLCLLAAWLGAKMRI
jgi:hypothetical protein